MLVGITGHQRLPKGSEWGWVKAAIGAVLSRMPPPLIGLSSLAIGADQLFARSILRHGGELRVIMPFPRYEETFTTPRDLSSFRELLARAASVEVLSEHPDRQEAYLAAGQRVVDLADRMIAVWNGRPAAGPGGTGDIVHYSGVRRKPVLHLNPTTGEVRQILP